MTTRRAFLRTAAWVPLVVTVGAACQTAAPAAPPTAAPAANAPAQAAPAAAGKASTATLGQLKGGIVYLTAAPPAAAYHVGVSKKFFDDEGVKLDVVDIQMPADGIQALGSDLAFLTPSLSPAVNAYNQGNTDLRVVAPIFQSSASTYCVRADSPIKEPKDVKGSKIAITFFGGSAHVLALEMLKSGGLKDADAEMIPISGGTAGVDAALMTGQVQVAPLVDPLLAKHLHAGEVRILWDPTAQSGFKYNEGVLVSHTGSMQKNPDLLKATIRAWNRSAEFIRQNPKEAGEIWGPQVNTPGDIAGLALDRIKNAYSLKTDWGTYGAIGGYMAKFDQLKPTGKMPYKGLMGDQSLLPAELQTPMPDGLPAA